MKMFNLFCLSCATCLSFSLARAAETTAPTDAQISGLLMNANEAEIKDAKLAKSKGLDQQVKNFAQHMIDEHEKNVKDQKELAKKISLKSDNNFVLTQDLKRTAQSNAKALKDAKGSTFDRLYIDQQIAIHQTLISDMETQLIPAAKNSDLKNFLENTKSHMSEHLKQAQNIQTQLTR